VDRKLNPKQLMFCSEYVIDFNGTQAAIRAGYSKKTARQIADQLLTKLDIQAKIQSLTQKVIDNNEDKKQTILDNLNLMVNLNALEFIEIKTKTVTKQNKKGEPFSYEIDYLEIKPGCDGRAIQSIKMGMFGIELKFHDKNRAIELLGKHLGMFSSDEEENEPPAKVTIDET